MSSSTRPNRVLIDLAIVRANVLAVVEALKPVAVIAAVKADAYGHGALAVAAAAIDAGAVGAATGDLESALRLRASGLPGFVLVFPGPVLDTADLHRAAEAGVTLSVHNREIAETWASMLRRPVDVYVKVALGLERLGVAPEEVPELAKWIESSRNIRLVGVLGHLHAAPKASDSYIQWQLDRFNVAMDGLERASMLPPTRVVAATGTLRRRMRLRFDSRLNAVDPGALLLGIGGGSEEFPEIRRSLIKISSRLLQVRTISRDEFVNSAPFPIRPKMRLGVLPMGQADGLPAVHAGRVLVRGANSRVLAVWTEHTAVDLTDIPAAAAGDEVVIYGRQAEAVITMQDVLALHPDSRELNIAMDLAPSVNREYLGASIQQTQTANQPR